MSILFGLIPVVDAQVASGTINTAVSDSISTVTDLLTTNLPLLIGFAISLIVFFFVWRLAKRFLKGRG